MTVAREVVRIAAMSDVHYSRTSSGTLQTVFQQVTDSADLLVLCGDLTDYGLAEEATILAKDLTSALKIPVVAVLGNHDFEAGEQREIAKILTDAGVRILDGDTHEIHGVGFAGVRGFCGGFGRGALGAWGEPIIKQFVHEALQEVLKLESALARLKTQHRIALIHYAPVRGTVEGEPLEIYPFLGSSRFEEPLTRYSVSAVFHGHAHRGSPEARTSSGIPVFNVCMPLLKTLYPERAPFRLFEVPRLASPSGDDGRAPDLLAERRQSGRRSTDRISGPGALVEASPPPATE
jgi:Icc-related predicted phosphoesterase